jgi:hypothetical protein
LQADGLKGQVQGGGAGVDGDGVFGAEVASEFGLELVRARAGGQPAGADGVGDFGDLGFVGVGAGEGEEGGAAWG